MIQLSDDLCRQHNIDNVWLQKKEIRDIIRSVVVHKIIARYQKLGVFETQNGNPVTTCPYPRLTLTH